MGARPRTDTARTERKTSPQLSAGGADTSGDCWMWELRDKNSRMAPYPATELEHTPGQGNEHGASGWRCPRFYGPTSVLTARALGWG